MRAALPILLCVCSNLFCQKLLRTAEYSDQNGKLFKIERAYKNRDSSLSFIAHYADESVCIKKREYFTGDTLVIREDYYSVRRQKTRMELYSEDYGPDRISWANGDSVRIIFYYNNSDDFISATYIAPTVIGDTILTGDGIKKFDEFIIKLKNDKVSLIRNGQIRIDVDSLRLMETRKSYFLRGNLVKLDVYEANYRFYSRETFQTVNNVMVGKMHKAKDSPEYISDSIVWNNDTSEISFYHNYIHTADNYRYIIKRKENQLLHISSFPEEIEYSGSIPSAKDIIESGFIYYDMITTVELMWFDESRVKKIIYPKGNRKEYNYTFSSKNVTREVEILQDGRLWEKILYY